MNMSAEKIKPENDHPASESSKRTLGHMDGVVINLDAYTATMTELTDLQRRSEKARAVFESRDHLIKEILEGRMERHAEIERLKVQLCDEANKAQTKWMEKMNAETSVQVCLGKEIECRGVPTDFATETVVTEALEVIGRGAPEKSEVWALNALPNLELTINEKPFKSVNDPVETDYPIETDYLNEREWFTWHITPKSYSANHRRYAVYKCVVTHPIYQMSDEASRSRIRRALVHFYDKHFTFQVAALFGINLHSLKGPFLRLPNSPHRIEEDEAHAEFAWCMGVMGCGCLMDANIDTLKQLLKEANID